MGDHIYRRRRGALHAKKHRRASPARTEVFQFGLSLLQSAADAKIILIVAGLAFRGLWPAAQADAARTEFEAGFALRLKTNKSVCQYLRLPAMLTFLYLLLLLLVDTLHAVVFATRDADARIAQSQLSLATTRGTDERFGCQISCGFATDTFLAYSVQNFPLPNAAFAKSRGYLLR